MTTDLLPRPCLLQNPNLLLPVSGEKEVSAEINGHVVAIESFTVEGERLTANLLIDGELNRHDVVATLTVNMLLPLLKEAEARYKPAVFGWQKKGEGPLVRGWWPA